MMTGAAFAFALIAQEEADVASLAEAVYPARLAGPATGCYELIAATIIGLD